VERKIIFISAGVLVVFFVVGSVFIGLVFVSHIGQPYWGKNAAEMVFMVGKGESAKEIAAHLKEYALISKESLFIFYVWNHDLAPRLQAGKYLLRPGMSAKEIADMMAGGGTIKEDVSVTVPEGFTLKDMEERFAEFGYRAEEGMGLSDFSAGAWEKTHAFLSDAPNDASLEGYLFPDTYRFAPNATFSIIVDRMLSNFAERVSTEVLDEITRQNKSVYDIVTMASLIEKEVVTEKDMKLVSGLLWKRMEIGMPLQVDATVVYAVGHNRLTYDDLAVDSPYNTYAYKGLPKGPIANPGLQAILAAVYPTASEYFYYLSKPDGETVFSRTLLEHNTAKNKYLR